MLKSLKVQSVQCLPRIKVSLWQQNSNIWSEATC
uniref:Uncharacterized protein n=1 Tax=Arundo donax TaxID=35708 RepID=A0A0A9FGW8_ARUDO